MVDVGEKPVSVRTAIAVGAIHCLPGTILQLREQALPKGDVLAVARIAGIQAAKKTADLIPLCHSLPLERIEVAFEPHDRHIAITAKVRTSAKTGVEMEALTAVSVAALTLYDMMKAVDKSLRIEGIQLMEKTKA